MTQFAKIKLSEKYITKSSQLNFSETPYFCGVQKHQKSWTKQNNCEDVQVPLYGNTKVMV